MKTTQAVDSARLSLLLNELRLPAIKLVWSQVAEQMHAIVHPADVQDRDGGVLLVSTLFGLYPFLRKLFAAGGSGAGLRTGRRS